jgi:putative hemolysin
MSDTLIEILVVLVLILANGVFAMAEIALVSARKPRLEQRAEDGDTGARVALDLAQSPNRFLSTTQIGISLIAVFSGAVGGATLADKVSPLIAQVAVLKPYANGIALVLVVLVITFFSLVLGELIPKRIGLNDPERVAALVARPMKLLSRLAGPAVRVLSWATDLGLHVLGARPSNEPAVTEEEIRGLLEQGAQVGIIEEVEQDMVESVFRLGERHVDALMTPRTEIAWLDLDEPLEEALKTIQESPHSRFPVAQQSLDNVVGVLATKDLLGQQIAGRPIDLRSLYQPAPFVPESTPALKVLEMFKQSGVPVALVIDEFGGLQGMVTLTDVLEAIVGDITVSGQPFEPQAVQREDGSWLFDGLLQIDELKDILDVAAFPDEDHAGYQTLGGFMMSQLGSIPKTGDGFDWEKWHFEVVDMDGRRVDKVLVSPTGEEKASR